ncbi:MAG: DNA polymerase III subunit [Oscillospiraceae bacterium]|nr:DNA polymerase III subunit [Oscillospiraceae bacterium]
MDFHSFLGNDTLKQRLSTAISAGKISHSYLLCGPEGAGKRTLARLMAAAMQCVDSGDVPCGTCAQCRKVFSGNHPDVIFVDDEEKKNVSVELARRAKEDLYIRPNEGKKKIYIFPRANDMNASAQNALLKVMEEPPAYGVFILLSTRGEALLPTIRSRCTELTLSPVEERVALGWLRMQFPQESTDVLRSAWRKSGGFLGKAKDFVGEGSDLCEETIALATALGKGDGLSCTLTLNKMEKLKREQLLPILQQMQTVIAEAMTIKAGISATGELSQHLATQLTASRLRELYDLFGKMAVASNANVGTGHICGYLAVGLRGQS